MEGNAAIFLIAGPVLRDSYRQARYRRWLDAAGPRNDRPSRSWPAYTCAKASAPLRFSEYARVAPGFLLRVHDAVRQSVHAWIGPHVRRVASLGSFADKAPTGSFGPFDTKCPATQRLITLSAGFPGAFWSM